MKAGYGNLVQFYAEVIRITNADPAKGLKKLISRLLSLWNYVTNWLKPGQINLNSRLDCEEILMKFISMEYENEDIVNIYVLVCWWMLPSEIQSHLTNNGSTWKARKGNRPLCLLVSRTSLLESFSLHLWLRSCHLQLPHYFKIDVHFYVKIDFFFFLKFCKSTVVTFTLIGKTDSSFLHSGSKFFLRFHTIFHTYKFFRNQVLSRSLFGRVWANG